MIKKQQRKQELGDVPFRSNRFFNIGTKWYFATREGFESGPYCNKQRAETSLQRFLAVISKLPQAYQSQH
jgi:hypothetical protein